MTKTGPWNKKLRSPEHAWHINALTAVRAALPASAALVARHGLRADAGASYGGSLLLGSGALGKIGAALFLLILGRMRGVISKFFFRCLIRNGTK